jgi:hypothetical protein
MELPLRGGRELDNYKEKGKFLKFIVVGLIWEVYYSEILQVLVIKAVFRSST